MPVPPLTLGLKIIQTTPLLFRRAFLEATADVGALARRAVAAHAERPENQALVIVTAMVQARVTTVEIPVIRDIVCCKVDPALSPYQRKSGLLERKCSILNFHKAELGGRACGPLTPNPLLNRGVVTPPSAGVPGGDSRCRSLGPTRCCSKCRKAREPGPGNSNRHGTGTGYYR